MSIIRKRSAAHKSYLPKNARDNQYILAEFTISDDLIKRFSPKASAEKTSYYNKNSSSENYCEFYQNLAKVLFDLSETFEVENCLFIANDKLTRVRFNQEMHQWQTNQQILFYYNPESHQLKKSFFDANKLVKKISLLFLTTGIDIRENASKFHAKISRLVIAFANKTAIDLSDIRLRDHQHITYDLFTKNKLDINKLNKKKPTTDENSIKKAHKLRPIIDRYASQQVTLPEFHSAMTYAIINLPISNKLLNIVDVDPNSADPYNPLYTYLTDTFTQSAKRYNLNNGALIANGLVPIVRYSIHEITSRMGEFQMLGYNPEQNPCGIISKWDASELVDNVQLVFVATDKNQTEHGFGSFLNQIEQAIKLMATELEMDPLKEEVIVRFHQHVAYNF